MSNPGMTPEALPAGANGVLVRLALRAEPAAMAATQALAADLDRDPPAGTCEIVPGLVSVLLRFDPARVGRAALTAAVLTRARAIAADPPAPVPARRRWTIPASFDGDDGPQLSQVAAHLTLSPDAAIAQLCAQDLRVLAIGFAPGQPYLGLLPEAWDLPRLADLTPQVPAGAIVVAVRQIVVFGAASATGWRQIGRTAFRSFWPDRDPPMPLLAGDAIRFTPVPASTLAALARDAMGGARLERLR